MDFHQFFDMFDGEFASPVLWNLIAFILWIVIIFIILRLVRGLINRTVRDNTLRYNAKKVVRFVGYGIILIIGIAIFTDNIRYFTMAIGLISAGIAFALQEVILSVAGWISILSNSTYKTGDRIQISDVTGDVIDIGITKTTLMELGDWVASDNYNGRIVQVSNGAVFKGPVKNYSADFPFLWDEINLPVTYGSDVPITQRMLREAADKVLGQYAEYAREHWKKVVKKYLIEDARVDPTIVITLTDNWINFNLRYVVSFSRRRITKDELYHELLTRLEENKDKVSIASSTLEVSEWPVLRVETVKDKEA